jgi:S1-C subfamily serine protease
MGVRGFQDGTLWSVVGSDPGVSAEYKELPKMETSKKLMRSPIVILLLAGILIFSYARIIAPSETPAPYSGVLVVQTDSGQGSCFVVTHRNGYWYAITAAHVVRIVIPNLYGGEFVRPDMPVSLTVDNEQYDAEIVRVDPEQDVALIRFKSPEKYRVYSFASAEVGESCTTVGWHGKDKLVYKGYVVSRNFQGFIVANGGIIPGCSGGALLNQNGGVIGVTVALPVFGMSAFDSTALYVPARFARAMLITLGE